MSMTSSLPSIDGPSLRSDHVHFAVHVSGRFVLVRFDLYFFGSICSDSVRFVVFWVDFKKEIHWFIKPNLTMAAECDDPSSSQPGGRSCIETDKSTNGNAAEHAHDYSKQQRNVLHQQQHQQQILAAPPPSSSSSSLVLSISIREFFLVTLTSTPFVNHSVNRINTVLRYAKVPEKSLLTNEEFVLSSTAVIVTLVGYYVLFGKRHRNKRKRLAEELRLAQRQVRNIVQLLAACIFDHTSVYLHYGSIQFTSLHSLGALPRRKSSQSEA
jgi:hypothetical protein